HEIENSLEQWKSLLHADDRERFEYLMEEIRSGKQSNIKTEYRVICKDKSFKWVSASFTAVYDKKNTPIRILGTHTDITERKITEDKLRESEFRYKNFFARNSAVMLILDSETGDIKDANQSALNYYGYSKEELLSLNISDINILDKQNIEEEKERAIKENREHNYFRHRLKDGSIRDVAVYSSKIEDEKIKMQYAIIFDITERRKAEKELEKAKNFAEEANRVKSFFVSNISHEIRTPLNAIIGLSELLLEDENLTPEQLENLNSIKYSSDHLLSVINDVLDFSKLEAGKVELEKTDFDLYKLVKESSKTIEFKTKEKNIGLNVSILPDTPRILVGDPSRLRQILLNLLSNAVKFTSKGHIDINVRVLKSEEDKVKLRFSVSDTGIGIPEEKQSELFQNFTQADINTSRKFGGTGLGLSICKKLVELQGGEIGLKSLEGMGSTFWFELEYQISEKAFIPDTEKLDTRIKNLKGMKILLVEDDKMNQFVMSRLLRKWQSQVDIAENGMEAVEKLKTQKYDVVLMDMHMPQLNGIEATKLIRNQTSEVLDHEVPIIALTADVTNETRKLVKEAGMNNFITKPSEQEDIYQRIVHTILHHKTEFFESTDTIDQENEEKKEQQQNVLDDQTKMRIKKALSDIFDDDMDSTLDLIGKFLKDIPRIIVGVMEALYDKDFATLRQMVHKIKPGYSYMGFTDVSKKIERIQELSKQETRFNELEMLCRELEDDSRDIVRILRDIQREYLKGKSINTPHS
ncbi:MAG: ATP-binding protein, partial [Bacteroidota bacterium]